MQTLADTDTPGVAGSSADILQLRPWPGPFTTTGDIKIGPMSQRDRVRRGLNVVIALLSLLLAAPLMLVIAVAIKLSSPGPVLFKQTRVGLDRRSPLLESGNWRRQTDYGGRLFTLYKFRTMRHRPGDYHAVWARRDDPRVFRVGSVLRRFRLDELPQLFNVLLGDMNIVGPRPEQPEIFVDLREKIDQYPRRQRVLPGITGLAQLNQHYDTCLEDVRRKTAYDLEYIRRASALEDLRIMLRTVPSVIWDKSGW